MSKRKGGNNNKVNNKRHQENDNTRQLDPVFGQYRALPIAQDVLDNITPDTVPLDADTYLAMVRKQAGSGSSVMFVPKTIDYDDEKAETAENTDTKVPTGGIPLDFREFILKEFEEQRRYLPEVAALPIPDDFEFPETFTAWRAYVMSHPPSVALISNLDSDLCLRLVTYFTRWLAANLPSQLSPWFYSLLVRVPEVMNHSDVSVVRELAMRAKKLHDRDELPEDTRLTCASIICIVGEFFKQKDLLQ